MSTSWTSTNAACACDCSPPGLTFEYACISARDLYWPFLDGPHSNDDPPADPIHLTAEELVNGESFPDWGMDRQPAMSAEDGSVTWSDSVISWGGGGGGVDGSSSRSVSASSMRRTKVRIKLVSQGLAYVVKFRTIENDPNTTSYTFGALITKNVPAADAGTEVIVYEAELPVPTLDNAYLWLIGDDIAPTFDINGWSGFLAIEKQGFVSYRIGGGLPKVYRTETASGGFAGAGDDLPAKTYSGRQEFTPPVFHEESGTFGEPDFSYAHFGADYSNNLSADVFWKSPQTPLWELPDIPSAYQQQDTATVRILDKLTAGLHDTLTLTLSNELTTAALKAAAVEEIARLEAIYSSSDSMYLYGVNPQAVQWTSPDEIAYLLGRTNYRIYAHFFNRWESLASGETPASITADVRWQIKTKSLTTGIISSEEMSASVTMAYEAGIGLHGYTEQTLTAAEGEQKWIANIRSDPIEDTGMDITVKFDLRS